MNISPRLKRIADMVKHGTKLADIGTDHGFLPIYLLKNNKIDFAICSDIKKGPLSTAEKNLKKYGFSDKVRLTLADGLKGIMPNEADSAVIAGMGGEMIAHILDDGIPEGIKEFILQPMRNIPALRKKIHQLKMTILNEVLIREKDKFYIVMHVIAGEEMPWTEDEYICSKFLKKDLLWNEYAESERKKILAALSKLNDSDDEDRKKEFEKLLNIYK